MKAFDPCLDTGEVGEGPAVGEVEEPGIESPVDGGQGYTSPVHGGQGYT